MAYALPKKQDPSKLLSRYQKYYRDNITILFQAKKGLKPEAVFDFMHLSELSKTAIEMIFNMTMKTFQNYYDNNTLLNTAISEKLLKLFALYENGAEVFGSREAFNEWLSKPAYGIGNEIPKNLIDTSTGIDLIKEELTRIEYGDLA